MIFSLGTGYLLLFIALAIPIGYAVGIAGIASLAMVVPTGSILSLMTNVVHATAGNYLLLTIPMFVLMAEFLSAGGVAEDLLLACNRSLRKIRGGMAMACILAGTIHAAATGSSTASAASLCRASFPAMRKAGYAPGFAVGTISIAGTLAIMIPPSGGFVLYGLMTDTSIGRLFIAGIVPGLLTAAGYMITISIVLWLKPELGPRRDVEAAELASSHARGNVWPMMLLIVGIIGGLYAGVATPTEIAALGALGALLISLASRRMTWESFSDSLSGTLRITTMIITIIFGAHLFGFFISFSKITDTLLFWIAESGMSGTMVMLLIVLIYLLLGMIMDQAAIIILTAPLSTALMVGLGYDPVWWGVIMIKTAEIGLVSPPLGLVTYVVSSISKTELRPSFMGVMPFIGTEMVLLALLLAFPQITMWMVE
jgi:C4-dicarboxylate transporter, DctM subunit